MNKLLIWHILKIVEEKLGKAALFRPWHLPKGHYGAAPFALNEAGRGDLLGNE